MKRNFLNSLINFTSKNSLKQLISHQSFNNFNPVVSTYQERPIFKRVVARPFDYIDQIDTTNSSCIYFEDESVLLQVPKSLATLNEKDEIHTKEGSRDDNKKNRKSLMNNQFDKKGNANWKPNSHLKDDSDIVIICLLGWLGAQWKHVVKFSDWYVKHDHISCLSFIPNMTTVISRDLSKKEAKDYVRVLQNTIEEFESKEEFKGKKIKAVFHALSGNGVNMYGNIVQELSKPEHSHIKDKIKACIVDSAPPEISHDRFTRGFVGAVQSFFSSKRGNDIYEHAILSPVFKSMFYLYLEVFGQKKKYEQFRRNVLYHQPHVPQLFIYSEADELIPPSDIQDYIRMQKNIGIYIDELVFKDSLHVEHFKTYPEEYKSKVLSFIDDHVIVDEMRTEKKLKI